MSHKWLSPISFFCDYVQAYPKPAKRVFIFRTVFHRDSRKPEILAPLFKNSSQVVPVKRSIKLLGTRYTIKFHLCSVEHGFSPNGDSMALTASESTCLTFCSIFVKSSFNFFSIKFLVVLVVTRYNLLM